MKHDLIPPPGCALLLWEVDGPGLMWIVPHEDPRYLYVTWTVQAVGGFGLEGTTRGILAEAIHLCAAKILDEWTKGYDCFVLDKDTEAKDWIGPWTWNRLLYTSKEQDTRVRLSGGRDLREDWGMIAHKEKRSRSRSRRVSKNLKLNLEDEGDEP